MNSETRGDLAEDIIWGVGSGNVADWLLFERLRAGRLCLPLTCDGEIIASERCTAILETCARALRRHSASDLSQHVQCASASDFVLWLAVSDDPRVERFWKSAQGLALRRAARRIIAVAERNCLLRARAWLAAEPRAELVSHAVLLGPSSTRLRGSCQGQFYESAARVLTTGESLSAALDVNSVDAVVSALVLHQTGKFEAYTELPAQATIRALRRVESDTALTGTPCIEAEVCAAAGPASLGPRDLSGYLAEVVREQTGQCCDQVFERSTLEAPAQPPLVVFRRGNAGRPVALLVNALGVSADLFSPLALALAQTMQVATWESRGFPNLDTAFGPAAATLEQHVHDLERLRVEMGAEQVSLVGYCSGAELALRYAASYPGRVLRLVCIGGGFLLSSPPGPSEFQKQTRQMGAMLARGVPAAQAVLRMLEARRKNPAASSSDLFGTNDESILQLTSRMYHSAAALHRYGLLLEGFFSDPGTLAHENLVSMLATIPSLFIVGSRDSIAPSTQSLAVSRRLPRARTEELSELDHYGVYNDPRAFELTRRFLHALEPIVFRPSVGHEAEAGFATG